MKLQFKLAVLIGLLSISSISVATTDVMTIVNKANLSAFYPADDAMAQARMIIRDNKGNQQIRQFSIVRKDRVDGGDQDILMRFSKPSDVKGTLFRVAKHLTRDDDRWLYLPALDLVKRIAAGDKRTSFVGSHFFYEDISGRNIADDHFTLLSETSTDYVINARPINPDLVEFASYQVTINKATMLPSLIEYTNDQGKVYRRVESLKVKKIGQHYTVVKSRASDLINGGSTLIQFRNIRYDSGVPNSIFNERSLRNPPKKWLK